MKRVVTGHDENGKAIFVKIGEPEHVVDTPGVSGRNSGLPTQTILYR